MMCYINKTVSEDIYNITKNVFLINDPFWTLYQRILRKKCITISTKRY